MKSFVLVAFIITLLVIAVFALPGSVQPLALQESVPDKISLRERLEEIGEKFDRRFTMEVILDGTRGSGSLLDSALTRKPLKNSLFEELEKIRETIPNLQYEILQGSKVIHIVDARIASQGNNPLDEVVREISFEGKVFDFVDAIARLGFAVSPRGMVRTHEMSYGDYATRVSVIANNKKVRDLLTDYIPLDGRGRILWVSTTYSGQDRISYIRFLK